MKGEKETAPEVEVQEQSDVLLRIAVGNSKFKRVVGEISKIIIEENLDTTPVILNDLLKYIANINLHSKV